MSLQSRRELLASTAPRYQQASKKEKQTILNELTAATGYHRKYALTLLKYHDAQAAQPARRPRKPSPRIYTPEVQAALVEVWEAANRICSKRLVPFLPEFVAALERHGHLSLSDDVRERLLAISTATVDRLLADVRRGQLPYGRSTTRPGSLLKHHVPVRTFAEWNEDGPGFIEADLVAHCGDRIDGQFVHTLVMTDVSTGWTEFAALLYRSQDTVLRAIRRIRTQLPFDLLGLDTDNGGEFLNYLLFHYCQDEGITFTRSRPYRENDQCHVEQKNGSIVRKFVGYDRFVGIEACRVLGALYTQLRLYVNFFQPSVKLVEKKRVGNRIMCKYDLARTPYQRVTATESISDETRRALGEQYRQLDPLNLLQQIESLQDLFWQHAYVNPLALSATASPNGSTAQHVNGSVHPAETAYPSAKAPGLPNARAITSTANGNAPPPNDNGTARRLERAARMYRRTKRKGRYGQVKRWWRTRKDPFEDVWDEVEQQLEQTPYLTAKMLFQWLQQGQPGKFSDGQLRTLQRRVHDWRLKQAEHELEANEEFADHVAAAAPSPERTGSGRRHWVVTKALGRDEGTGSG